jgi:ABC-2 type transport system permease protein
MGGVFMVILNNPDNAQTGMLAAKAEMMSFSNDWASYLGILSQVIGVGGVLIFGFVASWIFGREYSDGTLKDLLALPISRTKILNAKFVVYLAWCIVLTLSNLILGFIIGSLVGLEPVKTGRLITSINLYAMTALLTIPLGTVVAFFALVGKGYLAPLGFVALTLVLAQVVAAAGLGYYFPWSVPGLYSGAGGEFKTQLDSFSYGILVLSSILGYMASLIHFKFADHTK